SGPFALPSGPAKSDLQRNRPIRNGQLLEAQDFAGDLIAGFREMHELVEAEKHRLLDERGPLARFQGLKMRYIHRPTSVYVKALQAGIGLDELESAERRDEVLNRMYRPAQQATGSQAADLAGFAREEIAALKQLDIPYFEVPVDRCHLTFAGGGEVREYFAESGFSACRRRIHSLSRQDKERQCALIEGALRTLPLKAHKNVARSIPPCDAEWVALSTADLLREAEAIAVQIRDSAIRVGEGVTWLGPQLMPQSDRFQFSALGHSLYDGATGVAFFCGALGRVTGDETWSGLARDALRPLLAALQTRETRRGLERFGPGLATGMGGLLYGLGRCAGFLDSEQCRHGTLALLEDFLLWPPVETGLAEVMFGDAGAILGLLAVHKEFGEKRAIEKGIELGQRMIRERVRTPAGQLAWKSGQEFPTGFAHGAAGCAYALGSLFRACGMAAFRDAAAEALAFEETSASKARMEPGSAESEEFPPVSPMGGWCHGKPGDMLAKLRCERFSVKDEGSEPAVSSLTELPLGRIDQACCGNAGLLDILQTAALERGSPDLREHILRRANAMIGQARRRRFYGCVGADGLVQSCGLFQGIAGIGYVLLRLAHPERLPSFLGVD
ncbi:MAG TPA: type 2 lanthipeptide synthetase LanM, partial [Verrucomicrobiae bacterium]|nr:type 2 lanthipeptide synthetase LanM [Verrucomicrobiae bacterium]